METLALNKNDKPSEIHAKKNKVVAHASINTKNVCVFCKESNHYIQNCSKFIKLPVGDRIENIKRLKLCINCLRGNHLQKFCYAGHCKKCPAKQNTLLHLESNKGNQNLEIHPETSSRQGSNIPENVNTLNPAIPNLNTFGYQTANNHNLDSNVLLSTAIVLIKDSFGAYHPCRVLLDSGSQSNFISEYLCNRLNLKLNKIEMSVTGINQVKSSIDYQCSVSVESCTTAWKADIVCLVLPSINDSLPSKNCDTSILKIPPNIKLADPSFSKSGSVDLLIGAGLFYSLLCIGQISLGDGLPTLQKTVLGWIVSGSVNIGEKPSLIHCSHSVTNNEILDMLQKFWLIEEPCITKPILSEEENLCEELFQKTTKRNANGRFIVQIPLKESPDVLGESKHNAMLRLKSLESKFARQSNFRELYSEFLDEYLRLNHMSKIDVHNNEAVGYFLPHHGIFKENNQTTKLRVVFDASAETDAGISFNDIQLLGPTVQDDLVSILIRFRQGNIVICADIIKMYRQIEVCPEQRFLQKILWRSSPSANVDQYELNTVTYGTKSAPWLAVRCLIELARECKKECPRASKVIETEFYMDDLLTTCESLQEAITLADEITQILESGCFNLQKWASNSPEFLKHVKEVNPTAVLKLGESERTKTLGLYWNCSCDCLMYSIGEFDASKSITKRSILSDIAQVFDPLDLVSPCIIVGKIMDAKIGLG